MDAPDVASPPLPTEPGPSRGSSAIVVCVTAIFLLLPPLLYVGSFVLLVLDEEYDGLILKSLDERTIDLVVTVYWPLIWFCETFLW